MNKFAVCTGTFDPITRGHENIIRRTARVFGSCTVLVLTNEKKTPRFSLEEREAICRAAFEGEETITVTKSDGLLTDWLSRHPGAFLVKGIRGAEDLPFEKLQAEYHRLHTGTETFYLDASPEFQSLSSTKVRRVLRENGDLSPYLSEKTEKFLKNKL